MGFDDDVSVLRSTLYLFWGECVAPNFKFLLHKMKHTR